ncbi:hypothetical protein GW781_07875 [bacterium]|nr:hypothetical protein [bacterium]NCT21058.1 hypothetical protein [bacterium]OIO87471.1 MAG: hypothetical protein AUK01_00165 [Anaerolineae bacterium CG2_30_57_67]
MLNFFLWYLLISALGALTFPLARRFFPALADEGYSLSRALGLLLWGFFFWLAVSLGFLQNDPAGLIFSLLALAGLMVFWRKPGTRAWLKENWRFVALTETLFLLAFAALAFLRANAPEALGTEKPMELAFINAVLRSPTFPPHDPWLAGYGISYYYFGYVLTGMLAKLTATSGGVAFNLMIALVFALSAIGAFGLLYNLLAVFQPAKNAKPLATAFFGPLFLLVISNLEGFLEVLHRRGIGWTFLPDGTAVSTFWAWLRMKELSDPPLQPLGWLPDRFWWWWRAARVLHDYDLRGNFSEVIDEFPFFSYLLADLHPHVLAMPFGLLALALALNLYLGGGRGEINLKWFKIPLAAPMFGLLAVTLGGLAFLNTWDFPTYLALTVAAFVLLRARESGWGWARAEEALALAIPLGLVSVLLYLPFYLGFSSQAGGILPNVIHPTRGAYLWIMFGTLFVPIFLLMGQMRSQPRNLKLGFGLAAALTGGLWLFSLLMSLIAANTEIGRWFITAQGETSTLTVLLAATARRFEYGAGLLTIFLLIGGAAALLIGAKTDRALPASSESPEADALSRQSETPLPFLWLLILLGGLLVLAPEFIFLRDLFSARMNTVFKFYYQAWALWSLAAAFAAVMIFSRSGWLARAALLTVMAMGLVYPILSPFSRANGFAPSTGRTLDAAAYHAQFSTEEARAVAFLQTQPLGVVAEAATAGSYNDFGRIATLSGFPAVLGWRGHEQQWRGSLAEAGTRLEDMQTLYETPSLTQAQEILKLYNVRYIVVGGLERRTYHVNETKFSAFPVVFSEGETVIYLVP